jgi:hypothetical protein
MSCLGFITRLQPSIRVAQVLLCAIIPVLSVCGCSGRWYERLYVLHARDATKLDAATREALVRATRKVPLPASSTDISLCQGENKDTIFYLVFHADRKEIDAFATATVGRSLKDFKEFDSEKDPHFVANDLTVHRRFTPWKTIATIGRGIVYWGSTSGMLVDLDANEVYFKGL